MFQRHSFYRYRDNDISYDANQFWLRRDLGILHTLIFQKGPLLDRFKKNPFFSKPIHERMDEVMDLDILPKY